MKYLSVCSGIEAATVAWHGLGWTPVAFAEVEAFPSAVLAHHYPNVPNLGDLTRYREWPEELLADVDLLVGGTPCQAFSVAGLRRSLGDERGNLSLTYVNLYHHINEVRKRHGRSPAIALWENVPGVLSTKDNAFGCFIGGLLGCDEAPQTESGKWDKAGFLGSEAVRVGYRVLDAQYFGVAQRRRRVFLVAVPGELVASLGERACPSEILSLRESVLGNPPTRGAAWQGVARDTTACSASRSGCGEPFYLDRASFNQGENAQFQAQITNDGVAGSAVARGPAAVLWNASDQANAERLVDHAGTLNCNMGQRGGWIAGHPDPAYALSAGNQAKGGVFGSGRDSQDTFVVQAQGPVIFTGDGVTADPISAHEARTYTHEGLNFRLHNCVGRSACATGDRSHALTTRSAVEEDGTGRGTPIVPAVAFKPGQSEAAGGTFVTEEFAPTVQAQSNGSTAVPAVAVRTANTGANGHGVAEEVTHTIDQVQGQAIAFREPCPTLTAKMQGSSGWAPYNEDEHLVGVPAVAFTKAKRAQSNQDDESWVPGEVAPTQNQFDQGDTRATTVVAFTQNSRDEVRLINDDGRIAGSIGADGGMHQTNYLAYGVTTEQTPKFSEEAALTITRQSPTGGGQPQCVAFANRTRDGIKVPEVMKDGVVPALTNPGGGGRSDAVNVASAMQVRRLTPTECAYLQGFPADYLDITFRKKPAADGPKYRALGNSMAVPCMWWLGVRIHKATSHD